MDSEKQSFFVQAEDGRKFKMVIKGDLTKIPVEKIKRYLKSYNVPEGHNLTFEGRLLTDDMIGEDFGLQSNSILKLWSGPPPMITRAHAEQDQSEGLAVDVDGRQRQQRELQEALRRRANEYSIASQQAANSGSGDRSYPHHHQGGALRDDFSRPLRSAPELTAANSPIPNTRSAPFGATPHRTEAYQGPSSALQQQQQHPLQSQMHQLEAENMKLKREVEALRLELESKKSTPPLESLLATAKANLQELGKELGLHLMLDQNMTCVIGNDERHTILVTFDAPTERLYVYSTVLTTIPQDTATRMRLYETLLDGSLLGRDVAGGGIGVSLQSGLVMMSTSIPLKHCGTGALRDVVPVFVEALVRWRAVAGEILHS